MNVKLKMKDLLKYFQSKFYLVYNKSSCTTMNTLNAFKYINMETLFV